MKIAFLLIMCFAAAAALAPAQVCPPQAEQFVQRILHQHEFFAPFTEGPDIHMARSLGDCAATALTRNLRLKDLNDQRTALLIVQTLQYAFYDPENILVEQNRQPRAALLLLDLVAEHASDQTARVRANDLLQGLGKNPPQVPRPLW